MKVLVISTPERTQYQAAYLLDLLRDVEVYANPSNPVELATAFPFALIILICDTSAEQEHLLLTLGELLITTTTPILLVAPEPPPIAINGVQYISKHVGLRSAVYEHAEIEMTHIS